MSEDFENESADSAERTRLPELLETKKTSWLSGETGISRRMIDRYKAGAEPTLGNAIKIAQALNVPLSALAPVGVFSNADVGDLQRSLSDREQRVIQLENTIAQMSLAQNVERQATGETVMVPRLNARVAAGIGKLNYHDRSDIDQVPISKSLLSRLGINVKNAHFVHVEGDSMEELILDGDDVLIDAADIEPKPAGIYAVQYGEEAMLKRIQAIPLLGIVSLVSDNPRYDPITIRKGEQDQFRPIGRAKLVMRVL